MADAAVMGRTREALKGVIQKPPLTDKLLGKPPFRFLHDVISGVVRNTHFADGLYSSEELDAANVKEKEAKISFLNKMIDMVKFALETDVDVKSNKIVAGQEPEHTNNFLQKIAQAAKSTDAEVSRSIVEKVLAGEKPGAVIKDSVGSAGSNKENRTKKISSKKTSSRDEEKSKERKSKEKEGDEDKKKSHRSDSKDKDKDRKGHDRDKDKKIPSKDKDSSSSRTKSKDKDRDKKDKDKDRHRDKKDKDKGDKEKPRRSRRDKHSEKEKPKEEETRSSRTPKSQKLSDDEGINKPDSGTTNDSGIIVNGHGGHDSDNELGQQNGFGFDDKHPKSSHPSSAEHKSSAPVALDDNEPSPRHKREFDPPPEEEEPPPPRASSRLTRTARPSTAAGPGARPGTSLGGRPSTAARAAPPRLKRRELGEIEPQTRVDSASLQKETVNLIVGTGEETAEEEENFILEEQTTSGGDRFLGSDLEGDGVNADELDAKEHGGLVRKILETKKELESGLGGESPRERMVTVFDEKERERTRKDVGKLQETVQSLTRTAHPLGRLVDYQQEDIDSMLKELEQWRGEYKKNMTKLNRLHGSEGESLEPLHSRLGELDQQIREKRDTISAIRGSILGTEEKLANLMHAVGR